MDGLKHGNGYESTLTLLREHPEWRGMVQAALEEAQSNISGSFAGSWVLDRARKYGITWVPNLKKLVSYGVLEKVGDSTRGKRRAYYAMPDIKGVAKALGEQAVTVSSAPYVAHKISPKGVTLEETISVPFFADLASCGSPSISDSHIDDFVEIKRALTRPGREYFVVRATGDSMELAGIQDGDALLVQSQDYAEVGQNVVACLPDGSTVKELQRTGGQYVLVPRSNNKEHKPMFLPENGFIQGVVVAVLPNFNNF